MMVGCKTKYGYDSNTLQSNYFTVNKIKKLSSEVYIIYATRNDTIFKIASHYNGQLSKGKKLKKGSKFTAEIFSQFVEFEKMINMMPNLGVYILFHGEAIGREDNINDVYICDELNGPYLKK